MKNMPVGAISSYNNQMELFSIVSGKKSSAAHGGNQKTKSSENLNPDQEKEVETLKETDRKVRAHEQAHMAAGGAYVKGGVSYSYQKGPDGRMYAVGGEVSIDTSPVRNNPQATIAKMQAVKSAALAPADPSGQDRAVAAAANQAEIQARQETTKQTSVQEKGKNQTGAQPSKPEFTPIFTYTATGQTTLFIKSPPTGINFKA
jgi:hypothetical protein